MKVLVLGTGSVAIKLFPKLLDELIGRGGDIRYMLTPKAQEFGRVSFGLDAKLSSYNKEGVKDYSIFADFNRECLTYRYPEQFNMPKEYVAHIDNAQWADVVLVCPATANTIAKMVYGICDNVVMDTLLAASGMKKKIIVAPAMNTNMWCSWQTERNIDNLKASGVIFVTPTVKRLACGDYGIGGLADIKAIVDKVYGVKWRFPVDTYMNNRFIPTWPHLGAFGAVRRFDIHNGVDIYCEGPKDVMAVEEGIVVGMGQFTGEAVKSPWWNDTWYLAIEGTSGIVIYGEITYSNIFTGQLVKPGEVIGKVTPVLKKNKVRKDIKGHSDHMLHIELKRNTIEDEDESGGWPLNTDRPKNLLDPTAYLI